LPATDDPSGAPAKTPLRADPPLTVNSRFCRVHKRSSYRAVADLAHAHGALVPADNNFATPVNQRPLEFGVDVVSHSATKYLGGHSDVSAGVLAGRGLIRYSADAIVSEYRHRTTLGTDRSRL
jgi:hypothetical protein